MPVVAGVASGVQAGVGLYKTIAGEIDKSKAKKELESLQQPFYKVQDELYQNRDIAARQAQMGLPQETLDYMTSENQTALASGLSAIGRGAGSVNNVADLYRMYQKSIQATAAQDAAERAKNINQFMATNAEVAGQETMQWVMNEFNPYQNKVKLLQGRIMQNMQTVGSGISDILGAGSSFVTFQQNQDLINALKRQQGGGDADFSDPLLYRFGTTTGASGAAPQIQAAAPSANLGNLRPGL